MPDLPPAAGEPYSGFGAADFGSGLPLLSGIGATGVTQFMMCPERWRRRYLQREWSPAGPKGVRGSAFHDSRKANNLVKIQLGVDLPLPELQDHFDDSWRKHRDRVEWDKQPEGKLKDDGYRMVTVYHHEAAPHVHPREVESKFQGYIEGVEVPVFGYLDTVTTDNVILETKTSDRAVNTMPGDWRVQGLVYLAARRMPIQHQVVVAGATPRVIHLPRITFTEARAEQGKQFVIDAIDGIRHLLNTRGPDSTWPLDGLTHTWACKTCPHGPEARRDCPGWR